MDFAPARVSSIPRQPRLPIALFGGICALATYGWILTSGAPEVDSGVLVFPIAVLGLLAVALTLLDLRIGLGFFIFASGVSPEFQVFGVNNFRLEDFLFPIIFLAWIFRNVSRKEGVRSTDLKLPILLTVLLSVLSTLQNLIYADLDLLPCLFRLGKSIEYFLIFFLTLNALQKREDLKTFAYLMPAVSIVVGIYGIFQTIVSHNRVTGPEGETANILGGYYVLHLCLIIGLLVASKRHRIALFAGAALLVYPLLYTMSRTSYLAFLVGLLAMLAARRSLWIVVTLAASMTMILAFPGVQERFLTILGAFGGDAPSSLVMRVRGWMTFLEWLPTSPVLGQGIGNKSLGAFDNEYVRQLFELGVFGLVFFFWMAVNILRTSRKLQRQESDPELQGFALGVHGATAALLVHSLGATTFTTIRTSEPFFLAIGLLYSIQHLSSPGENLPEELPAELPSSRDRLRRRWR